MIPDPMIPLVEPSVILQPSSRSGRFDLFFSSMYSAAGSPTTGSGSAMISVITTSNLCTGWQHTEQQRSVATTRIIQHFIPASYLQERPPSKVE
jgi:hypothetical protein